MYMPLYNMTIGIHMQEKCGIIFIIKENGYPDIKEWNIQVDDTNINPIGEIFGKR